MSATDTPKYQGQLPFNQIVDADVLSRTSTFIVVPPARKRQRAVSRQNALRLRDEAKADCEAGRETKFQKVHRCLSAFENRKGYWPTAAELTRWMHERREIPREDINLVAPKLSIGENGDVKRKKDGTKYRIGGGLFERLPLRTCRVTGGDAHPVKVREVGSKEPS